MAKNQTTGKTSSSGNRRRNWSMSSDSKMVNDYQVANQNDVHFYNVGRKILEQILAHTYLRRWEVLQRLQRTGTEKPLFM